MKRLDYEADGVAEAYDRGRSCGAGQLEQWMDVVAGHVHAEVGAILDLGCGTGRFSEALAARFNARIVGMDLASGMLKRALAKRTDSRVAYLQGRGEALPLRTASVDLVFISMVFHHFKDRALVARECRRVLRPEGCVLVRTGTREHIDDYPYVDYFPSSRYICQERLPSTDEVGAVFLMAGFEKMTAEVVTQQIAGSFSEYVSKLSPQSDSVIASLSDDEFSSGVAAMKAKTARDDGPPVVEPIDLFAFR